MRIVLLAVVCFTLAAASRHRRSTVEHELVKLSELHDLGISRSDMHRLWNNFKTRYGKVYESVEEEVKRVKIFFENMVFVEKHNKEYDAGRKSHSVRINEYADMSHEEFVSTMNGFKKSYGDSLAKAHASSFLEPLNFEAPQSIDWREHGYVTPVKNQGQCGSCWSFSATGALEGQHFRKTGKLVSLSEQNLVDCSKDYGNNGCEGGLMDQAFQYIKDNDGIDTESTYPYQAKDGRCRFKRSNVGADDTGFVDVKSGSESALKKAVASVGPVSVAIDASHQSFQFYNGGIYKEPACSSEALDHGVLVVGYGTDEDGNDYWLVKNSWGESWGDRGYVHMLRNHDNQCGVATQASYPLV